jgi:DNA repair protein RadC
VINETKPTYRIADIEVEDRPRERLARLGAQALTNAELIAILLRVGVAGENVVQLSQRLLGQFGGLYGLRRASFEEVSSLRGVGIAKAAQLKAAIELGYRLRLEAPEERPAIHSPADAAALVQFEMEDLVQENLWVLNVDTRNRLMAIDKIYQGSLNASMVRVGELFKAAIQRSAAGIIMVHNHPSGDPTPSPEDATLTRAVISAGKLLDIDVLDHLVIGRGKFASMKERRLGFT